MADHKMNPLQLQWGRSPGGRFSITMVATALGPAGQTLAIPIRSWVLSKDEEEALKATLHGGLVIASGLPGNGHAAPV